MIDRLSIGIGHDATPQGGFGEPSTMEILDGLSHALFGTNQENPERMTVLLRSGRVNAIAIG
jgi:hypothetical protein